MASTDDPEEPGTRILIRFIFPSFIADFLWKRWLRRKHRREQRHVE